MIKTVITVAREIFTGRAYALTLLSGILTITIERYLFRLRNYTREAKVTAIFGWTYIIGGTLLYLLIALLSQIFL